MIAARNRAPAVHSEFICLVALSTIGLPIVTLAIQSRDIGRATFRAADGGNELAAISELCCILESEGDSMHVDRGKKWTC